MFTPKVSPPLQALQAELTEQAGERAAAEGYQAAQAALTLTLP